MRTRILEASVTFRHQPFIKPLRLSSGVISEITEARAEVVVSVAGREAVGRGAIYLSDLWAWPDPALPHADRDARMRTLCERIAVDLFSFCGGEPMHPLELGLRLPAGLAGSDPMPALARLVCTSPFDAAIHDATGRALGRSAFDLYADSVPVPSADPFFEGKGACAAIADILQTPRRSLEATLVVGAGDSLEDIIPWVRERGYRCFKLKIGGRDTTADVARTVEVYRAARDLGVTEPWLSVDSNCASPDAQSVLEYLEQLEVADREAYAALAFVEQPTGRDITVFWYDWRAVSRRKPVLLDEGLTGLNVLPEAEEQAWSGLALKTCKGHSLSLAAAAWGHRRGMALAVQDLTNPGLAAIHSALLAAHLPAVNTIELNSPQYTPAANADWLPRLGDLLEPVKGMHFLPYREPVGLGSDL